MGSAAAVVPGLFLGSPILLGVDAHDAKRAGRYLLYSWSVEAVVTLFTDKFCRPLLTRFLAHAFLDAKGIGLAFHSAFIDEVGSPDSLATGGKVQISRARCNIWMKSVNSTGSITSTSASLTSILWSGETSAVLFSEERPNNCDFSQ